MDRRQIELLKKYLDRSWHEEKRTKYSRFLRKRSKGISYEAIEKKPFVVVLLYDDDNIYMRKEIVPSYGGGLWLVPIAGGIEKGESPVDAALREAYEEAGYIPSKYAVVRLIGQLPLAKGLIIYPRFVEIYDPYPKFTKIKGDGSLLEKASTAVAIPKTKEGIMQALEAPHDVLTSLILLIFAVNIH